MKARPHYLPHLTSMRTANDIVVKAFTKPWFSHGPRSLETEPLLSDQQDEVLVYIESVGTMIYDLRRSATSQDVLVSISTFYRSITGRSVVGSFAILLTKFVEELSEFVPRWQSSDWIDVLDDFHRNIHRVRDSALGAKLIEVFNHVVAHTFYHKMGLEVDSRLFYQIEKGYLRPTVWNVLTFADAILSLLVFLAKAGRQAMLTGNVDCFFIDSGSLSEWLMEANRLRKDAEFLGNPDAVGIEVPSYLAKIQSAIESGNKFAKAFKDKERMIIQSAVLELELVEKRYTVALCSSSFRRAPYGIFLYGSSKIAKSFILKGLFNHYCSVRGVDKKDAILYPRNPGDKYYSGFRSNMLGIVFDDVGQHRPDKVMGIDPTLGDIVSVSNNIPFITNQADLADKGKIPLLCEFVGVTSNLESMGVEFYFRNTYAVLRRLPFRIQPITKKEFLVEDSATDIDPAKIPQGEQYPDCWDFIISKPVCDDNGLTGRYIETGQVLNSFRDLLAFLTPHFRTHIAQQERLMTTVNTMGPEELCECGVPESLCCCRQQGEVRGTIPPMLFGDEDPEGQAFATSTEPEMIQRAESVSDVKKHLLAKQRAAKTYGHLFIENFIRKEYRQWMVDYFHDHEREFKAPADFIAEFERQWEIFDKSSIRGKMYLTLQQHADKVCDDDSYLTFIPKCGGRRNFIRSQLNIVMDLLEKPLGAARWSKPQRMALEAYVYERVPIYLSTGWDDESILKGAWDYVDTYACEMVPDTPGRELLTADLRKGPTLWDRFCRKCAETYVYYPRFRGAVNWGLETRVGKWIGSQLVVAPNVTASRLVACARVYDNKLGGRHPFVILVLTVCTAGAVIMMVKAVMSRFTPKSDVSEAQISVHAIGRKPIQRQEEKKNVWVVPERNITALDFVPGRMNNAEQFIPALMHNIVYIEYRSAANKCRGHTRGLVINTNTILINRHSYFEDMVMEVFLTAKKTGVVGSCEVCVTPRMVEVIPERDLAIITTHALPAHFKDISRNLPRKSNESVGPAAYYIRGENGKVDMKNVAGVQRTRFTGFVGDKGGVDCLGLTGTPDVPTVAGECGSPLVINTPYGPIIAGIHAAYDTARRLTHAVPIYYEDFELHPMVQIGKLNPAMPVTQGLTMKDKLYTDFYESGKMIVFGRLEGFRSRPTARGTYTEIASSVMAGGLARGVPIEDKLHRPVMGGWEPIQNIVKEYLTPTHSIDEVKMLTATTSFIEHIRKNLAPEDVEDLHPVPVEVAINGYPEVPNVDAQKFTTSGGHGYPGSKKAHIAVDEPRDEWPRFREYTDKVMDSIQQIVDAALSGHRSHPIFTTQLKDEMVSLRKVVAMKTRGFYMGPMDYLTALRMFTLGLTRIMVRKRDVFRNAIGLNTHSEEWDDLFKESEKIPGDNWIASDFKGFDKILSILLQNCCKKVFVDVAALGDFSEAELLALDTLLCDLITAVVDFFGTLVMLLGGEVSGHGVTTHHNSVANIILHVYAWVVICGEDKADEFWLNVFIRVLGDDIMAKVHPDYPMYNHTNIQRVFDSIGIEYTMADKLSESRPYISFREVSFLKRTFRESEEFHDMMVAPLELDSIWKMLLYTIPSKAVSPEEQLAMSICAAKSEAFYHGREVYELVSDIIDACPKSVELEKRMEQYPAPTYEQCKERFIRASPKLQVQLGYLAPAENPRPRSSYCDPHDSVAQSASSMDYEDEITMGRSPEESHKTGVRLSSKKHAKRVSSEERLLADNDFLSKNMKHHINFTTDEYGYLAPSSDETAIIKLNAKRYRRVKDARWRGPVAQSATAPDTFGNVSKTEELYTFQAEPEHVSWDMAGTVNDVASRQTMTSSLASYMSRPELVSSFSWAEGSGTGVLSTIDIWRLTMTPAKREKLSGFGLFRANLKLKFIVNGSPFYYGALAAVYTPLSGVRTDLGLGGSVVTQTLMTASQKPHVWLNVQNTSTAEMKLPFLYPYPHINTNVLVNFNNLGKLELVCYRPLASANGITGAAVDVQVYAWFEDVEMTGPTNQPVAQSHVEYENDGQISGPASAIATTASALSSVPILGPYAMATSKAAGMVASVANALGFTNVPNISDVAPMKQKPFSLASSEISEPIGKLSLLAKQETKIGKEDYGATKEDELHLSRFCSRESYLTTTVWSTTAAAGDILFTTGVTPMLTNQQSGAMSFTPMAYASIAFQYWRGPLKFTFKAIRSKYHRGRVQISWDRSANNLNTGALLGNPNTQSVVLDLDQGDEVSMVVPYQQQSLFLPVPAPMDENGVMASSVPYSTSAAPPSLVGVGWNGVLNMRVLTRLTSPEASSDVAFLVIVSAADGFELAGPVAHRYFGVTGATSMSNLGASVAQSAIVYDENAPDVSDTTTAPVPSVYQDAFGERIVSLRTLLHRSSRAATYVDDNNITSGSALTMVTVPLKRLPPMSGFWNNAWYNTVTPAGSYVNTCPWHPLTWFTYCFAGYSGSVNVTANVCGGDNTVPGYIDDFSIVRATIGITSSGTRRPQKTSISHTVNSALMSSYLNIYRESGSSGMELTNTRTNAGLSANLPYYVPSAFLVADPYKTYNNQDSFSGGNDDWWKLNYMYSTPADAVREPGVDVYYGSGPDFNTHFFVCCPILFTRNYTLV